MGGMSGSGGDEVERTDGRLQAMGVEKLYCSHEVALGKTWLPCIMRGLLRQLKCVEFLHANNTGLFVRTLCVWHPRQPVCSLVFLYR